MSVFIGGEGIPKSGDALHEKEVQQMFRQNKTLYYVNQ